MGTPAEKRDWRLMRHMFGTIAPRYDFVTRRFISIEDFSSLLRQRGYAPVDARAYILGGVGLHWAVKS